MLILAIIATVVEVMSLLKPISDTFGDIGQSDMPIATLIGGLVGFAIRAVVIVAIWVLYSNSL